MKIRVSSCTPDAKAFASWSEGKFKDYIECEKCGEWNHAYSYRCQKCDSPLSLSNFVTNGMAWEAQAKRAEVSIRALEMEGITLKRDAVPEPEPGWLCPTCRMNNSLSSVRCVNCGKPRLLPSIEGSESDLWLCPYCNKPVVPGSKFCCVCGKLLPG